MPERDPLAAQLDQLHAPASHDLTTDQVAEALEQRRSLRLFGSGAFFRLWVAQVVSSLGDWVGLFAILALAARIGGGPASVGLVAGRATGTRARPRQARARGSTTSAPRARS